MEEELPQSTYVWLNWIENIKNTSEYRGTTISTARVIKKQPKNVMEKGSKEIS